MNGIAVPGDATVGILWNVRDMDDATIAAKAHDAAAVAYVEARAAYEAVVMGGDIDARAAARARMDAAASVYTETLTAVVAARKAAMPSFEALLADPAMQLDADSMILASIVEYSSAKPATAARPAASSVPASSPTTQPRRYDLLNAGGLSSFLSDTADALTAAR